MRNLYHLTASNTLASRLDLFLISCKVEVLSEVSIHDYRVKITPFVNFCNQSNILDPKEVTREILTLFFLDLRERNKPVSVLGYHKVIKRFFNWLVEQEYLEKNPMDRMKPPKVTQQVIKPFSQEQIKKMLAICNGAHVLGVRNISLILLLYDTGIRRSEAAAMNLDDINFDRGIIKINGKGAKERIVGIGKQTQRALLKYLLMRKDNSDFVWINEYGGKLTGSGIAQTIETIGQRAGIEGVRCSPHTFRHTFATDALRNGAGEFNVQSLLGHDDLRMTRRYSATLKSEYAVEAHRKFSPVENMGIK